MTGTKFNKYWAIVIVSLTVIIVITGFVALVKHRRAKPIEILLPQSQEISGNINIDGAIASPGIYPFSSSDSIGALLQSAGGVTADGTLAHLELTIPQTDTSVTSQKININTAEAWLLEALPGIGSTKAKAIIAYRQKNGLFYNVNELLKVDGISSNILEQIKPLITVSE